MSKSILYFCSVAKLDSGMPLSTLRLVKIFKVRYNVSVGLPEKGELGAELEKIEVKYELLKFRRLREFRGAREFLLFFFRIIPAQWRLFKFITANEIKIVHFSDIIDLPFFITAKISGAKVISHLRVILEGKSFVKKVYLFLVKHFVDKVVCVSNAVRQSMFDKEEWSEKIQVIHNPAPISLVEKTDNEFTELDMVRKDKNFKVCYISKFVKVKGHINLLKVAKILKGKGVGDVSYYVIGGQEEGHTHYYQSFLKKRGEFGLNDVVKLFGKLNHNQTLAILSECDVLVHLPDYQEPLPRVVMEAFGSEKPVVAYSCGGIPEIIENNKSGFIVDMNDYERVADRIIELKIDSDKRIKMGQFARETLYKNFNEEYFADKINSIYEGPLKS